VEKNTFPLLCIDFFKSGQFRPLIHQEVPMQAISILFVLVVFVFIFAAFWWLLLPIGAIAPIVGRWN
jgi:hypothetical protein